VWRLEEELVLLFVTGYIQLAVRIPYQRSSGIVWRLQHRRKRNRTVQYADKEQTVLQGVIGRLIEIGKFCELENNVEKSEIVRF
jgi:hypothetical protein